MTRPTPTPQEIAAGTALAEFLRGQGHKVDVPQFEDRPDVRLVVDGLARGCECVQIPPSHLFSLVHRRFNLLQGLSSGAKALQVVWPKEAHVWTLEAIADKASKLGAYRQSVGSEEVDLLIHGPKDPNGDILRATSLPERNQIRWAANQDSGGFKNIYFWCSDSGVERIFPSRVPVDPPRFDFTHGYPTDGFVMTSAGPFKTVAEGEAPVEYDYGIVEPEVLIIPPTDARFLVHVPHFKLKRFRLKIVASSTSAESFIEYI